jgi:hypothetical protein
VPPQISVPPSNTTPSRPERMKPGSKALLQGLQAQPALNGKIVIIKEYLQDQGRYLVAPVDPAVSTMPVLAIKAQNLTPIAGTLRQREDSSKVSGTSASSGSTSKSSKSSKSNYPYITCFKPGTRARLMGLKAQPTLNGHLVSIVEYLADQDRYRVKPLDVAARDACDTDLLAIKRQNLVPEDPLPDDAEPFEPGTRAVLTNMVGTPSFNGQLVTIVKYLEGERCYQARPLGREAREAAPAKLLKFRPCNIKRAPPSAFWVKMTIRGQELRIPVVCKVERNEAGLNNVVIVLDGK